MNLYLKSFLEINILSAYYEENSYNSCNYDKVIDASASSEIQIEHNESFSTIISNLTGERVGL